MKHILKHILAVILFLAAPVFNADSADTEAEYVVIATRDLRILLGELARLQAIAAVKGCL